MTLVLSLAALTSGAAPAGAAQTKPADAPAYSLEKDTLVYVGTYTGPGKGKGIYAFRLQPAQEADGAPQLVPLGLAAKSVDPAFLAVDSKRRLVFAINEIGQFEGKSAGSVSAFSVDPASGRLTLLNRVSTQAPGPCHLVLDATGRHLLIANYSGGSTVVVPVAADGRLGEATSVQTHHGKSVNPQRQEAPHAHSVTLDPAGRFAYVCDLGTDQVMIYRFDATAGKISPAEPAFVSAKPGAGPRHLAFRPDGKFAYAINELDATITTFSCDPNSGKLTTIATNSTLAPGFRGTKSCAEIAVLPDGKFLYGSNRGADTLAMYAIDAAKGTLTYLGEQSTGGKTPRHFGVFPDARHLAMANQDSNTIHLARIDAATGRLSAVGAATTVPAPVCVVFLPPPAK